MKRYLLLIFFALISLSFYYKKDDSFKRIKTNIWANKFEVTNAEYKQFLASFEKESEALKRHEVKEEAWTENLKYSFNEPMREKYFSHPAFDNYPVVNITLESALAFCKWRSEIYNNDPKREFRKVNFRLPSEQEWQQMANAVLGNVYPWRGEDPYEEGKKGKLFARTNIKVKDFSSDTYNYIFDGGFYCTHVGSYDANSLGLHDVIGNVAELTSEGFIKGGSWDNELIECAINKRQAYSLPDPRVGFRVVMEILEE